MKWSKRTRKHLVVNCKLKGSSNGGSVTLTKPFYQIQQEIKKLRRTDLK
jgi:hypothetical protein